MADEWTPAESGLQAGRGLAKARAGKWSAMARGALVAGGLPSGQTILPSGFAGRLGRGSGPAAFVLGVRH